ncbi:MAG: SDR family oxidoreductase [Phycisphaerales bacterium]|nr:SDR family oxidoreductase [Phycisphaerales bacterium]
MLEAGSNVLITGATGLIGGELVRTLITQPVGKVWALARPTPEAGPALRLGERLRRSGVDPAAAANLGVRAVAGDITIERLGLSDSAYEEICREADIIIHSAAETSFIRAAACRKTNIAGARNIIDFTRTCQREPLLVCISTAYVSGVVADACLSEEEASASDHHNEYTRSKAVAEELFNTSGLPVLTVRPSVVLSAGVPDSGFARAILQFVPLLAEFEAVPIDPVARPDAVPVQYVVDSIVRLLQLRARKYDCYHISAGNVGTSNYAEMARVLDRFYQRPQPLRLISPKQWNRELHRQYVGTPKRRRLFASLRNYLPFLNMNVAYDNSRLRAELGERFPALPPLTSYLFELLRLMSDDPATARMMRLANRA